MILFKFVMNKWVIFLFMSIGLATTIMLTALACSFSNSPYAVVIVFLAFVAISLPTACCYDMQGTDAGDVGWALTGFFGISSVGFLAVLWRAEEVGNVSAGLTLGAVVSMLLTTSAMGWYFLFRKHKVFRD